MSMKIIQIAPIVENHSYGNSEMIYPNEEATIYGLGDDGKVYMWSLVKSDRIKLNEPDEDGNTHHYRKKYGWRIYE